MCITVCAVFPPDYTMVNFVKPNLLGNLREFTNRFANPIKNGQCQDSMPSDVRLMKQRAHILHELLSGSVQVRLPLVLVVGSLAINTLCSFGHCFQYPVGSKS